MMALKDGAILKFQEQDQILLEHTNKLEENKTKLEDHDNKLI